MEVLMVEFGSKGSDWGLPDFQIKGDTTIHADYEAIRKNIRSREINTDKKGNRITIFRDKNGNPIMTKTEIKDGKTISSKYSFGSSYSKIEYNLWDDGDDGSVETVQEKLFTPGQFVLRTYTDRHDDDGVLDHVAESRFKRHSDGDFEETSSHRWDI